MREFNGFVWRAEPWRENVPVITERAWVLRLYAWAVGAFELFQVQHPNACRSFSPAFENIHQASA
jgi:hypothetical protein